MSELALLGLALGAGLAPSRVALLGAAMRLPWLVIALAVIGSVRAAGRPDLGAALFCGVVATELRAGATLRQALAASARSADLPNLAEGVMAADTASLGKVVAAGLPGVGPELESTVSAVARSGAGAADLFDEMAALAIAQTEVRREVAVATAPARATAAILVGAAGLYVGWRLAAGELAALMEAPAQRFAAIAGVGLVVTGASMAGWMVRRSR